MEAALAGAGAFATAIAAAAVLVARAPRVALLGMAATLVLSPLALSPLPLALPLAFWMVAALLATFLLLRSGIDPAAGLAPLPMGGWTEAGFAVALLALGWAVSPVAGAGRGAPTALAAGLAVGAAAVALVGFARDPVRTAIGTILLLDGAGLVAAGLGGTPGAAQMSALALASLAAAAAARDAISSPLPNEHRAQQDRRPRPGQPGRDPAPPSAAATPGAGQGQAG